MPARMHQMIMAAIELNVLVREPSSILDLVQNIIEWFADNLPSAWLRFKHLLQLIDWDTIYSVKILQIVLHIIYPLLLIVAQSFVERGTP